MLNNPGGWVIELLCCFEAVGDVTAGFADLFDGAGGLEFVQVAAGGGAGHFQLGADGGVVNFWAGFQQLQDAVFVALFFGLAFQQGGADAGKLFANSSIIFPGFFHRHAQNDPQANCQNGNYYHPTQIHGFSLAKNCNCFAKSDGESLYIIYTQLHGLVGI